MRPKPQTPSQHPFQLNKVNKLLPSQLSAFNVEFHLITPCSSGSTGREGHTHGNQAGHLSHRATCEICSDPTPTEIMSHWRKLITKDYIEMNLNAYSYFCICTALQSWVLSSAQLRDLLSQNPFGLHQSSYCIHHQIIKGSSSPRLRR